MSKDPGSEKKKLEKRISTIKTSIQNIEWKKDYKENLHELVLKVNLLVTHAYAFSKYIFIKELETDPTFDLNSSISSKFFTEVFITLTNSKQLVNQVKPETAIIRTLLRKHREDYLKHSKFRPPSFSYAQQNALYEAQKIFTAYTNNISGNFGNILRKFINKLLRKEERVKELRLRMEKSNYSKKQIDNMIRTTITNVCTKVKLSISKKDINQIPKDFLTEDKLKLLQEFISAYPLNYQFDKDSIYYDVKSRPENHFKPFFVLSKLCELHNISVPVCFPLRKTNIPCHITIDTKILKEQIIKAPKSKDNKMEAWARVVNLGCKAFKEQGQKSTLVKFQGMILTDGISVSIIKQNFEPGKGSLGGKSSVDKVEETSTYVEDVDISNTEGKCVLIDPGRRDLMFCIHESSTPTNPQMLRYTQNTRAYETKSRHYRKIRQSLKPDEIETLELELSKVPSSTVNVSKYETYLQTRGRVDELLKRYYSSESQAAYDAFRFEDYGVSLKVDENCCLVFQAQHKSNSRKRNAMTITHIKGYYPRNRNNDDNDSAYNLGLALMEPHFTNRMTEEDKVEAQMLVEKFYDKSLSLKEFEDLSSLILKKLLLIPFRKPDSPRMLTEESQISYL